MTTRPLARPDADPPSVRLRDPAGVVAAVPYLLGFVPSRSMVAVGIDDAQEVGPTVRVDWEPGAPPDVTEAVWRHLRGLLTRHGCTSALVVVYTAVDPAALDDGWAADLLGAVLDVPGGGPPDLEPVDVLVVGPTRFRSLLCPRTTCCPADGSPVAEAGSHPVAATFVLHGRSPASDRDALVPVAPAVDPQERAAARRASAARRGVEGCRGAGGGRAEAHDHADLLARWAACLPAGPDGALAGELATAWLGSTRLRDACLAVLLPDGDALARDVLGATPSAGGAGGGLAAALDDPACTDVTATGTPVLVRMAALVTGPERAGVLAAHAWLCWVAGEGTTAGMLAERALVDDPAQPMAALVLQCVTHGLPAPWATARSARRDRGGRRRWPG